MANNWQYTTLSAGERLSKIRNGEMDVYTQEIARTNEVIKNRKEVGLDISEQLAWIKKLDYVRTNNNGLGGALTAEEIEYNTKTGKTFTPTTQSNNAIANLNSVANFHNTNIGNVSNGGSINSNNIGSIIGNTNNTSDTGNTSNTITSASNIPNAPQLPTYTPAYSSYNYERELKDFMENQQKRRNELEATLKNELNEKYKLLDTYYGQVNESVESDAQSKKSDYYANAVSRLPSMYERFANSGLSFDGGRTKSEQMSYNNALNESLATIDAQAINAVNTNNLSRATERTSAYSEYTNRLSQENARLDNMEYQTMRDLQNNAFRQNQFEWEQYQYNTQYEFEKYKYEQQLRETAEQKTLEQLRWEKEFGLELDAFEFDKLLKQNQLELETSKFQFDKDKYAKEYAMKLQEYDLKFMQYQDELALRQQDYDLRYKQYHDDVYFKQQDYELRSREFNLKADLAEFNKMLDGLRYSFDIEKFEKEYALKQNGQNFDAEKLAFDIERFYKEYEMKREQYAQDYEFRQQQSSISQAQSEREMALKGLIAKSSLMRAEKDYALKYLNIDAGNAKSGGATVDNNGANVINYNNDSYVSSDGSKMMTFIPQKFFASSPSTTFSSIYINANNSKIQVNGCITINGERYISMDELSKAMGKEFICRTTDEPGVWAQLWVEDLGWRNVLKEYDENRTGMPFIYLENVFYRLDNAFKIFGLHEEKQSYYLVSQDNLIDLNWHNANDDTLKDLNRVLEKYEINTPERIRHFLAQCMVESGNGLYLKEGEYVKRTQEEYENYYNTKTRYGYNYRGGGYIQTTWLYSYQAFATFMISEAYPELGLKWRTPANTDEKTLSELYETAKNAALSKGYNIKEYTDIVDKGTDYVAENFAWEIAGFWWKAGGANEIVDKLTSGNSNDVDKITSVVNKYTNSYAERRKMYEEIMKIIG